jgi:hypothetical protein
MKSWLALGVGAGLVAVGLLFMRWHVQEWRQEKNDPALDPHDRDHYYARYRRRMQTSGMITVLGILIPLWDWLGELMLPIPWTIMGFVVFGLIGWIILMAFGDMLSTRSHSHAALSKVRQKQRELERQVAELKNRGGNGHSESSPPTVN